MKNVIKSFAAVVALLAFNSDAFAQANQASASVSATIITPITITKDVDMNFGNLSVLSNQAGTLTISPAGVRTAANGVSIAGAAGTVAAASFTVNGANNYSYAITLPGAATTISDNASNTMTVDNWSSNPSTNGTLNGSGTQTLTVGARLNVAAGQPAGVYNQGSNTFNVTVNYN